MLQLRDYQQAAVDAAWEALASRDDNPAIVIPTAGGKTPVMAALCRDAVQKWNGRVLILAHVKELLEQSYDELKNLLGNEVKVGIYSSGLKRWDVGRPITVAGIQSVWRKPKQIGGFDVILVDEAHLIPQEGDGMYRSFLTAMKDMVPHVRIIGLTATPFRMTTGMICRPDNILNHVCFEVGVRELIDNGYICRLVSKRGETTADMSEVHVRNGEYIANELERACLEVVEPACREIVAQTRDRKACLVFCAGVQHAHAVSKTLNGLGVESEVVTGETPTADRDRLVSEFRNGTLKYLVNVNVFTTGFNARNVDTVAILRPTLSPGLYYQMCGRGFRTFPEKTDCLVLDFGGNIRRHGPVDQIQTPEDNRSANGVTPMKTCPECGAEILASARKCEHCGCVFSSLEPPEPPHEMKPEAEIPILSVTADMEHEVEDIAYNVHRKKGSADGDPRTLRVEYQVGFKNWVSEFVCFEHQGYARTKACLWWKARSTLPVPNDSDEAMELCNRGLVKPAVRITTRKDGKWDRVIRVVLGEMPEPREEEEYDDSFARSIEQEEAPF